MQSGNWLTFLLATTQNKNSSDVISISSLRSTSLNESSTAQELFDTFLAPTQTEASGQLLLLTLTPKVAITQPKQSKIQKYDWFCGNETEDKRFIQHRIAESGKISSGWRSPLRSMTLEEPQNWQHQLELDIASPDEMETLGKQDPVRIDRQGSVSLACCSGKLRSSFTTIKVPRGAEPMQNVQAMFLAFGTGLSNMTDMKVYIDSDTNPVNGTLINVAFGLGMTYTIPSGLLFLKSNQRFRACLFVLKANNVM